MTDNDFHDFPQFIHAATVEAEMIADTQCIYIHPEKP